MNYTINAHTEGLEGKRIAVAFSGGRDSVCLLHFLKERGEDVFAVNVEHGIRGENSLSDTRFAREFCKERGIPFQSHSVNALEYAKENGLTIEQAARELRYSVFKKLLDDGECDVVALAHHLGDQSETVLMRILRGTGIKGLRGMSASNGGFCRPLLGTPREEIDNYVREHNLPYVEDETNSDCRYTRNYLRKLIAQIKLRYPAFDESMARLARNAAEADDFIEKHTPRPLLSDGEAAAKISDFSETVTAKKLISACCAALGAYQDIEERHYALVFGLARCENGSRIELPHSICAHKDGDYIVFGLANGCQPLDLPFDKDGMNMRGGYAVERVSCDSVFSCDGLYIDCDKLPDGCRLRTRKAGDFIEKFGGGTKSLGDFLTDKKIPLRQRDSLLLIACGSEVYAICGVEISKKAAVDENSVNIMRIYKESLERCSQSPPE